MAKTMKARLLATAFMVVIAIPLLLSLGAQQAYAADDWPEPDPNKIYITFAKEKNSAGQVTSIKANIDIGVNLPNATYLLYVYKNGKQMSEETITSTTYDLSSKILGENGWGSGTYSVAGFAMANVNGQFVYIEMYSERVEFRLHTITIDTGGHGDNVVLRNVDDGTIGINLIWHGYIETLSDESMPPEYYEDGEALVGVAYHPKDYYSNMEELEEELFYALPFRGVYAPVRGNATLYAIWFDVIDQVDLSITAPACNTETTTQKNADNSWNWDSQTNPPELSVPEGSHYHFSDGSLSSSGLWNANAAGSAPYVGALTGGNSYLFEGYLESDYGYVFPGESDGLAINCSVNGGSFTSWANESYEESKLYGLWLDPDDGYGTTPLWVTGSIPVEHIWETGSVVQKATPSADGIMGLVCSACGATSQETFAHPAEMTLSNDPCVYNGTAKEPAVTVKDTESRVVDPSNYDVSYEANTNAGSAKAKVTFKGDYCEGSMEKEFTIERKPVTVTANNASKTFVEGDPQLTATVSGLVEGEDASLISYSVTRDEGDTIGTYAIRVRGEAEQGNYQVTFVDGVFTVTGLPATITASDKSVAMGKTVKIGATANSGGAITYKSSNTAVAKVNATTGVVTPVKAGTANITVTVAAKGDYAVTTKAVKVTVTPGTQSLTFKKQTKKLALAKVKKARQTVAITKAKGAKTTVTYKKVRVSKKGANFTVNKKTGKITVKKGTPKGTYKVTVKATAAKTANWKVANKTAVITIAVK